MNDVDIEALAVTLASAEPVEGQTADRMFATLYRELHRVARRELHRRGPNALLGTTSLLHEAYVDMSSRASVFPDKARFLAYASRAMRALIIGEVRGRRAIKRGGQFHLTSLDTTLADLVPEPDGLVQLNDALAELASADEPLAELVDLKFFCGFSFGEIAALRGVSERTVQRDWAKARMYLHDALGTD